MAGRGFYINFRVPELDAVLNNISRYDARTAARIEEVVRKSTLAIKRGAASRIHNVTGYLRRHTVSSFRRQTITGTISEKAPHAHLVEFGHGGPASAREHPTMRPAFEDERPNLIQGLAEAVRPR